MLGAGDCVLCARHAGGHAPLLLCMLEAVEVSAVTGGAGGDAPSAALYSGRRGGLALFAGGAEGVGGDALCAALYAGGCGVWVLFVGGVGRAGGVGGDAMCATLYTRGCRRWALFAGGIGGA